MKKYRARTHKHTPCTHIFHSIDSFNLFPILRIFLDHSSWETAQVLFFFFSDMFIFPLFFLMLLFWNSLQIVFRDTRYTQSEFGRSLTNFGSTDTKKTLQPREKRNCFLVKLNLSMQHHTHSMWVCVCVLLVLLFVIICSSITLNSPFRIRTKEFLQARIERKKKEEFQSVWLVHVRAFANKPELSDLVFVCWTHAAYFRISAHYTRSDISYLQSK